MAKHALPAAITDHYRSCAAEAQTRSLGNAIICGLESLRFSLHAAPVLEGVLGHGATAVVRLARHVLTDEQVRNAALMRLALVRIAAPLLMDGLIQELRSGLTKAAGFARARAWRSCPAFRC